MMKNIKPIIICSLCFNLAYATNDDLSLSVAQILLNEGNAKDGYNLLLADFDHISTNPLEYRLLGLLAKATGRPREASNYFKKVIELSDDKSLVGEAKLELAQIAYSLGNKTKAKTYLSQVKANKPPAKVGDNIDSFLEIIETKDMPKNYQFSASLGYLYDSNANAGTTVDSVLMFGLPFTLSNTAKETSDSANQISLGFNHNTGLTDDMSMQNSILFNRTDYSDLDNLDSSVFSGSTGLSFKLKDNLIVSLPFVADWVKVGHDKSYYSYSYGLAPQLRYQVDKKLSLNVDITLSRKKYKDSSSRNSENYSISPSLTYQINQQSYTTFGLVAGKIKSELDYYSNDTKGINARYGYAFTNGLQSSINASYIDNEYKGKENAYMEVRHDKTTLIGVSASYWIKAIKSNLIFSINHTNNNSNLPIYEYDRNQVSLSLRKIF